MTNAALGYGLVLVAIVFFGSNFLPTKSFPTGNGLYFTAMMAAGIWSTGMLYYIISCSASDTGCARFEPFAMLGGVIWSLGNVFVVTIVKCIGMGLGLCIWGSTNLLAGWACGRFGLLGVTADPEPARPGLQYAGVALALTSTFVFLFIKSDANGKGDAKGRKSGGTELVAPHHEAGAHLLGGMESGFAGSGSSIQSGGAAPAASEDGASWVDALPEGRKKMMGIVLSLLSGACYGTNFNAPSFVAHNPDKFPGASSSLTDYVFPHFCGILAANFVFFAIYAALSRNKPAVYSSTSLPAIVSGVMWAVAQISFFYANANLGQSTSFPLISVGPSLVGALWGVFLLKEISGSRNLALLGVAFGLAIGASVCIALSK